MDTYVRQVLYEALANGLEDGIINGTGKDMPIGMTKQVGDSVTIKGGVYPDKKAVKVTKFNDVQLGKLAAVLAINEKGQARTVDTLILVVNPSDYFSKSPSGNTETSAGRWICKYTTIPDRCDPVSGGRSRKGCIWYGKALLHGIWNRK